MALHIDSLVRVVMAGGNVVLSGDYHVDSLVRVAMAAKDKGTSVTIKTSKMHPDNMVRVCMAAPGLVTFDLT